jgi:uncharacterized Zn finger protein
MTVDEERGWYCPTCGSGSDEHRIERDGPESLDMVVCQRCGATWLPRPVQSRPVTGPK